MMPGSLRPVLSPGNVYHSFSQWSQRWCSQWKARGRVLPSLLGRPGQRLRKTSRKHWAVIRLTDTEAERCKKDAGTSGFMVGHKGSCLYLCLGHRDFLPAVPGHLDGGLGQPLKPGLSNSPAPVHAITPDSCGVRGSLLPPSLMLHLPCFFLLHPPIPLLCLLLLPHAASCHPNPDCQQVSGW